MELAIPRAPFRLANAAGEQQGRVSFMDDEDITGLTEGSGQAGT